MSDKMGRDLCNRIKELEAKLERQDEIIKAVAHIGVDFGYGPYELEAKHIQAAREALEDKA